MAHAAIALGTLSGGWRIIHTMGSKITKLVPMGGFAAETAGAITIFASTALGIPVSTTHVITGAIVGVGSIGGGAPCAGASPGQIVWAWLLTIPVSALIGAGVYSVDGPVPLEFQPFDTSVEPQRRVACALLVLVEL